MQDEIRHCHIASSTCKCSIKITNAMLSIFGRVGAILLAVVDVSHAQSCVEGSTEAQHEAFMGKLTHIAGRCLT